MKEENEEYLCCSKQWFNWNCRCTGDMMYILCGTIIEHGLQHKIEEVLMKYNAVIWVLGQDGQTNMAKSWKDPLFKPDF
jgi:hypothetical protein